MNRALRVLWFNLATDVDDPVLGFTTSWINAVAAQVQTIDVVTMRAGRVELHDNARVWSVGKEKGYGEARRVVEFYRALYRILDQHRVDVCFSHMIPIFSVLAAPIMRPKGIPIVSWYTHPHLTTTLKLAHLVSERVVTSLPTSYPYRRDKLTVLGHGIDTRMFSADAAVARADPPLVLCVGRISQVKDIATLVNGAARLRELSSTPFSIAIVGDPAVPADVAYRHELLRLIAERRLGDVVHLEPSRARDELVSWYRRASLLVNLTGIGSGDKVVFEALATETPALVANAGFDQVLGRYADDLRFRFKDADDLAGKLDMLLRAPDRLAEMGPYLRARTVEQHGLDGLATRLSRVLVEAGSKNSHER